MSGPIKGSSRWKAQDQERSPTSPSFWDQRPSQIDLPDSTDKWILPDDDQPRPVRHPLHNPTLAECNSSGQLGKINVRTLYAFSARRKSSGPNRGSSNGRAATLLAGNPRVYSPHDGGAHWAKEGRPPARAWWYTIRSTTTGLTFLPDVGGKRPRPRRVLLFHFADRARGVSAAHVER